MGLELMKLEFPRFYNSNQGFAEELGGDGQQLKISPFSLLSIFFSATIFSLCFVFIILFYKWAHII